MYGNGIVHQLTTNERRLPLSSSDTLGTVDIHHDRFDYDPNGNILGITDLVDSTHDRLMTYDGANRLSSVESAMFGNAGYDYDPLDNLRSIQVNLANEPTSTAPMRDVTLNYDTRNRLSSTTSAGIETLLGYDVRGNVEQRNGFVFDFDLGNRLRSATGNSVTETYRYDGNGRRAQATRSGQSIFSMYGQDGVLRYQRDEHTGLATDYIYLGGSIIAESAKPLDSAASP